MVIITDKHDCCGCSACVQSCPKKCIKFDEDEQGFRFPIVNLNLCIRCGLCEKVCLCLNQRISHEPIKVYAAINPKEEIRIKSSSGGIFTLLAENIIKNDGIVFGARFNENWEVVHDFTDTIDGIKYFRGSKYVQSRIGETYKQTQQFLKEGRDVLFSGTPCQIAGLKLFLRKEYDNLLTVDVVCHGVPSPKIWREYIEKLNNTNTLISISMKDKSTGWRGYSYKFEYNNNTLIESADKNKYQLGFVQNLTLRQSCFKCPAKAGKSGSDITLADYWGIEYILPQIDDNKGTSFVCGNTNKGLEFLQKIEMKSIVSNYKSSIPFNSCITESTHEPSKRDLFWQTYSEKGIQALFELKPQKINLLKRIIKGILPR